MIYTSDTAASLCAALSGCFAKHAAIAHLKKLDEELIAKVLAGAIAFLVGDFVRSGKLKLSDTRQELEKRQARTGEKIFLAPEEVTDLLGYGEREIGALTYCWASPDHPDPKARRHVDWRLQ